MKLKKTSRKNPKGTEIQKDNKSKDLKVEKDISLEKTLTLKEKSKKSNITHVAKNANVAPEDVNLVSSNIDADEFKQTNISNIKIVKTKKLTKPKALQKVKTFMVSEDKIDLEIQNDNNAGEVSTKSSNFIGSTEESLSEEVKVNTPKKRKVLIQDAPTLGVEAIIQGALYVAGKEGMTLAELHKILTKLTTEEIHRHLLIMQDKLEKDDQSGICIKDYGGRYKLLTKPEIKKEMQRFTNVKFKNPLNSKLMEVLAIIAYNQPCTRPRISEIRGADSAALVDILLDKGLVVELGRADTWGRPFIYEVSERFFDLFGITKIEELPEVQDFDVDLFQEGSFFDSNRFDE